MSLSLVEYDSAVKRLKRHPQKRWWTLIALYALMLAVVGTGAIARHALGTDSEPWWLIIIPPCTVAAVGVPILLALIRRGDQLPRRYSQLVCPSCNEILCETAIHLTGCCGVCGTRVVAMPDSRIAQRQIDFETHRILLKQYQKRQLFWIFGPFSGLLALSALAALLGAFGLATVLFGLGLAAFPGSLLWSEFNTTAVRKQLDCPECLHKGIDIQTKWWAISTGKCLHCRTVILKNRPSLDATTSCSRKRVSEQLTAFHRVRMVMLAGLLIFQYPVIFLVTRNSPWSVLGWAVLAAMIIIVARMCLRFSKGMSCPDCRAETLNRQATIASGCCCNCGVRVFPAES